MSKKKAKCDFLANPSVKNVPSLFSRLEQISTNSQLEEEERGDVLVRTIRRAIPELKRLGQHLDAYTVQRAYPDASTLAGFELETAVEEIEEQHQPFGDPETWITGEIPLAAIYAFCLKDKSKKHSATQAFRKTAFDLFGGSIISINSKKQSLPAELTGSLVTALQFHNQKYVKKGALEGIHGFVMEQIAPPPEPELEQEIVTEPHVWEDDRSIPLSKFYGWALVKEKEGQKRPVHIAPGIKRFLEKKLKGALEFEGEGRGARYSIKASAVTKAVELINAKSDWARQTSVEDIEVKIEELFNPVPESAPPSKKTDQTFIPVRVFNKWVIYRGDDPKKKMTTSDGVCMGSYLKRHLGDDYFDMSGEGQGASYAIKTSAIGRAHELLKKHFGERRHKPWLLDTSTKELEVKVDDYLTPAVVEASPVPTPTKPTKPAKRGGYHPKIARTYVAQGKLYDWLIDRQETPNNFYARADQFITEKFPNAFKPQNDGKPPEIGVAFLKRIRTQFLEEFGHEDFVLPTSEEELRSSLQEHLNYMPKEYLTEVQPRLPKQVEKEKPIRGAFELVDRWYIIENLSKKGDLSVPQAEALFETHRKKFGHRTRRGRTVGYVGDKVDKVIDQMT